MVFLHVRIIALLCVATPDTARASKPRHPPSGTTPTHALWSHSGAMPRAIVKHVTVQRSPGNMIEVIPDVLTMEALAQQAVVWIHLRTSRHVCVCVCVAPSLCSGCVGPPQLCAYWLCCLLRSLRTRSNQPARRSNCDRLPTSNGSISPRFHVRFLISCCRFQMLGQSWQNETHERRTINCSYGLALWNVLGSAASAATRAMCVSR